MKNFGLLFASALALLALAACSDDEDGINKEEEYDDSYYAAQATVTSSDANFTATSDGGTINFKTEGGTVSLNVSCGCAWTAVNEAADQFTTSVTSTTLTVTAEQNTVEEELTGTIIVKTSNEGIVFATITITQSAYGAPEISVETAEWNAPAKGVLTTEITVDASAEWTAESADEWLTVEKTEAGIILTVSENEDATERDTKVTLTCTDGIRTEYEYVAVTQDGLAYITLSDESVSFGSEEGSATVTVESNFDWDYSYNTANGWLKVTRNGDILTVTSTADAGDEDRTDTVALTAGDGKENVVEAELTVTQSGNAMIFVYTITEAETTTQLPLYGTVNCTADWGDGSDEETITTTGPSHTYTATGEYDVVIKGTVTGLYTYNFSKKATPLSELTAIKQWGKTGLNDMTYAFYWCDNLVSLPEHSGEAFADVTTFYGAFGNCISLMDIPAGLFENCTNATSFYDTFRGCTSIEEIPAGLFDDCINANNMAQIFYDCSSLKIVPTSLFDNCIASESFKGLFQNCAALEEIPAGLFDNNTNVTVLSYLFSGCSSLITVPAGLFDNCREVDGFLYAFNNASSLTTIPEGLFDNCPKATDFKYLFYKCASLEAIPAGLFDNNTWAEDFQYAIYGTAIKEIPTGLFDNCNRVTNFSATFYNSTNITEIPEGLFDNCPNVTKFSHCFRGCTNLVTVPTSLFDKNLQVTYFNGCFQNCSSVVGESPYTLNIDGEKIHIYERRDRYNELGCSRPTSYSDCFTGSSFSDIDSIPSNWGGNN